MARATGCLCGIWCSLVLILTVICLSEGSLFMGQNALGIQNLIRIVSNNLNQVEDGQLYMEAFTWSNCGSATDPLRLNTLTVSPDPLPIPGNISVTFDGDVKSSLTAPIELSLHIDKKVLVWVKVPCIDNVGSCTYSDVCSMLQPLQDQCPPAFKDHNIPCSCPFKSGHYALPKSLIDVSPLGIPSWLENGDYKVQVELNQSGNRLACWLLEFSLTH